MVIIQNTQRTPTTQHQKTIQLENWQVDIFPKTPTDGQQAHEKMLKIINQGNLQIKTTMRYPSHLSEGLSLKKHQLSVGGDMEKKEHSYTVGGNVNWCSHYGDQYGDSSKD